MTALSTIDTSQRIAVLIGQAGSNQLFYQIAPGSYALATLGSGLSFVNGVLSATGGGGGGGGGGTVTGVSGTAPIVSDGNTTNPTLSISPATTTAAGSLAAADKVKLNALSGTNTGDQTSVPGNAGTATKWVTPRNLSVSGDTAWTLTGVDGSSAVTGTSTIQANVVDNTKLAQVATATFKGRTAAGTGNVQDLTATQAAALLPTFTSTAQGVVPASGGGTTNFLRADGTFAAPSTGSSLPPPATIYCVPGQGEGIYINLSGTSRTYTVTIRSSGGAQSFTLSKLSSANPATYTTLQTGTTPQTYTGLTLASIEGFDLYVPSGGQMTWAQITPTA